MPDRQWGERRRRSYLNIAGHPIHALTVAIPIGLYAASFATALVALVLPRDPFWSRASWLSGAAAAGSAALVAVAGLVDFLTLTRSQRARRVGFAHMLLNSVGLALQVLTLCTPREELRKRAALQSGVMGLVSGAGFAGGELVYRHRIGVFGRERQRGRRRRSNASYYVPATD